MSAWPDSPRTRLPGSPPLRKKSPSYLVFMFKDIRDWLRVLQLLKVAKVDFSISRKSQKIGIGRVINGKTRLDRLDDSPRHRVAGPEQPGDDAQAGSSRDTRGS